MTEQLKDVIDRDYITVYKKKLDDVYKNPVGASAPRLDKGERESRITFIVSPFSFLLSVWRWLTSPVIFARHS